MDVAENRRAYSLLSLLVLTAVVAVCLASVRLAVVRTPGDSVQNILTLVAIFGVFSLVLSLVLASLVGWRWYAILGMFPVGALLGAAGAALATLSLDLPLLVMGPVVLALLAWNTTLPVLGQRTQSAPDKPPVGSSETPAAPREQLAD